MKIVAGTSASRAAHATDCPWLPAVAATTPAARSLSLSCEILLTAPRILNEPVRWRLSAFRSTSRPASRENVSDGKTGVTLATPAIRSRAARMSASVGTVLCVAKLEHPFHDLAHRAERIELARLHLVEQPPQLRIVRDGVLEILLRTSGRDRQHLAGEILAPPLVEHALGLEERSVL